MTERWIIIAAAKPLSYVRVGNAGFRTPGFWLNWRGKRDWCQPHEFLNWADAVAAIEARLALAGLRLVNLVLDWRGEFKLVRVAVQRLGHKLRRRAYRLAGDYPLNA
jgi:hypothetical protein